MERSIGGSAATGPTRRWCIQVVHRRHLYVQILGYTDCQSGKVGAPPGRSQCAGSEGGLVISRYFPVSADLIPVYAELFSPFSGHENFLYKSLI